MSNVVEVRRIINTATLLASDVCQKDHDYEHTNFLYKSRNGSYFIITLTQCQGERDAIQPLSKEEAKVQWDLLSERRVSYEIAFDEVSPEA